jgi:hypothetical protein
LETINNQPFREQSFKVVDEFDVKINVFETFKIIPSQLYRKNLGWDVHKNDK